jgi:hypothetical protein
MKVYQYNPLQFSWSINQQQGSLRYYLQAIVDPGATPNASHWASGLAVDEDNLNSTFKSVNGLNGGTKYYWRVIAYYDDGVTSGSFDNEDRVVKYSSVYSFETQGGAITMINSFPSNGATVYTLKPTFYWYSTQYESSLSFEVIIADASTVSSGQLTNIVHTLSSTTNYFAQIATDLQPSKDYWWQVKTTYTPTSGPTTTSYSTPTKFTTDDIGAVTAYKPTPSYPTGGVTIYTTAPTLYWYVGGAYSNLEFKVRVRVKGGSMIVNTTTDKLNYTLSNLTPGTTYEWQVKSGEKGNFSGNNSQFSNWQEFTVTGGSYSSPVASYPVNNPTVYTNTPTLGWYFEGSTLGWNNYVVVWSKTDKNDAGWESQATGSGPSHSTADMNTTSYTIGSGLDHGDKYYWAVAAYDGSSYSDWAEGSFTVVGGSSVSILLSNPSDKATVTTTSPTLTWYLSGTSTGIQGYRVTYSQGSAFPASATTTQTTNLQSLDLSGLTPGGTYYWYVELTYDGSTYERQSAIYEFSVDAGSNSVVPKPGSPSNGVSIAANSPVLSWRLPVQSESDLSYEVELSNNADFTNSKVYSDISELNARINDLEDGEYYWRVKSKTGSDESSYSETANFKVGDNVTDVKDETVIPDKFTVHQNYPNPFNPVTSIKYAIPEASNVTIKVYNMLGQEVRTLVNSKKEAGTYSVNWNGEDGSGNKVSSGAYIYRVTAGENIVTKKMILLK